MMAELQRKPNLVDVHVGSRIRVRRRVVGLSQDQLAGALGLTFQQVQKYERGSNRVSASKLFGIATILQAPVNYFFQGLAEPDQAEGKTLPAPDAEAAIRDFLGTSEGLELARRFPLIPRGRLRKQVLELVRALADETEAARETTE